VIQFFSADFLFNIFLQKELGDDGILLYPSHPFPALYHYSAHLRIWNFSYTAIINALKLPATQVPMGLNSKGLPLGVQVRERQHYLFKKQLGNIYLEFQVIGNMNCDRQCIAVAEELERAFGGWVPPFKTSS
jgi:fatty acid amide hydrolase 2